MYRNVSFSSDRIEINLESILMFIFYCFVIVLYLCPVQNLSSQPDDVPTMLQYQIAQTCMSSLFQFP